MTPQELNIAFRALLMKFSAINGQPAPPTFLGNINNASLPNTTEYTVFTKILEVQRSFNAEYFEVTTNDQGVEVGHWITAGLFFITYQVDWYGAMGQQRRQHFNSAFNSGKAAEFLQQFADRWGGIGTVKGARSINATEPDGTGDYAERFISEYTLTVNLPEHDEWDWAEELKITIRGVQ